MGEEVGLAPNGVVVAESDTGAEVDDVVVVVVNDRLKKTPVVERCHELMRDRENCETIIWVCITKYIDDYPPPRYACGEEGGEQGSNYYHLLPALRERLIY